jgi:bacteriorhodopsin
MAPLPSGFTYGQWSLVYNSLSFGIAGMGSATIFFWLQLQNVNKNYRTALTITGLVTAIATYHYVRIFNSWVDAFEVKNSPGGDYSVAVSGAPFNDAYRYVDWLLTVPFVAHRADPGNEIAEGRNSCAELEVGLGICSDGSSRLSRRNPR